MDQLRNHNVKTHNGYYADTEMNYQHRQQKYSDDRGERTNHPVRRRRIMQPSGPVFGEGAIYMGLVGLEEPNL